MVDVSVIIPTYKGFDNVCRTIDSVLAQSFKNVEVIVVDDNGAGTEEQIKTEGQLKKYSSAQNVIYIKHDVNRGGSTARNTGAKESVGKYVFFIDDDDSISSDDIEKQFKCMEEQKDTVAFSYSSSRIYIQDEFSNTIYAKKSGNVLYDYLMGNIFIGTGCFLLRRKVWEELGGYDESFVRHQDWEFLARILDRYEAVTVPDVYFERHIINRNIPGNLKKAEECADYFIEFLKRDIHSLSEKKLKNVINLNNSRIAIKYLKNRDLSGFFERMKKYDSFIAAYTSLFNLTVKQGYNRIIGKAS